MPAINIVLNGEATTTDAATLGALLVAHGMAALKVATALNGQFVPASRRDTTCLSPGDRVEIVSPRQGG